MRSEILHHFHDDLFPAGHGSHVGGAVIGDDRLMELFHILRGGKLIVIHMGGNACMGVVKPDLILVGGNTDARAVDDLSHREERLEDHICREMSMLFSFSQNGIVFCIFFHGKLLYAVKTGMLCGSRGAFFP